MAYNEFSIESAIAPRTGRPSVKIQGAANAVRIMQNPSRATEDYVQGAITSLGAANRQILYVNSSLEALNDRLRIASKIAYAVNTSKRRGAEGFGNVPMMNPWEFALEEDNSIKSDGFFRRVWDAIKTACRRVIEAIAHLIKYIGNAVASMDTKMQQKHYDLWDKKGRPTSTDADNTKFKSPDWKIKYSGKGGIADFLTQVEGAYASGTKEVNNEQDLKKLEDVLKNDLTAKRDTNVAPNHTGSSALKVDSKELANEMLKKDLQKLFAKDTGSAKELVLGKFCNGTKNKEMSCKEMKLLSEDFKCLAGKDLATKATKMISAVHEQQKTFTKMTKLIDQIASKVSKPADKNNSQAMLNTNHISNQMANICNSRIRYNSYWTSLILEVQMMCLRYNKSAHIALKHYLRAAKVITDEKKTTETENASTEALFQF